MGRRRLAVVVFVPGPVVVEIDGLRKAFGDTSLDRIAPHVTLIPPVNVRDEDVEAAVSAVDQAAREGEPFPLMLGPPETFLPVTPVLYLHVGGDDARDALGGRRTRAFVAPLARPIGHEFEPHVTLGRARHAPYRIEAAITAFGDYRAEVVIDRLTLVELVRPDDAAAVWTPVHEARFGGPAIVARGPMQLELSTTAVVSDPALALLDDVFGPTGQVTTSSGARHGDVATRRVGERQPPADQVVVTARRDGQVLGVLVGRRVGARGEWSSIDAVAVAPEHRGQGIAGHLLRRFDTP